MSITELKTESEIYDYLEALEGKGRKEIAVDLEAELNLHCYGEHVCLIQIFDLENEIIIDPFRFRRGAGGIKRLFEKPDLVKIMYDSLSDAALLDSVYGIRLQSVLDLRPAIALLEYPKQGLSQILTEELGNAPLNKKKFQQYNWMTRPLSKAAIEYAMGDVRYLFMLKDVLFDKLRDRGLLDAYLLRNSMLHDGRGTGKVKPAKYEKAKGYRRLDKAQQELFKQLFILRDSYARRLNRPPDYVFSNARLLELCMNHIQDPAFVEQGINRRINRQIQADILGRFTEIVQQRTGTSDNG